jgi:hypothetical protein
LIKINLNDILRKMSLIYSLIANEKKIVLADNSEYNGNFSQIIGLILNKIAKKGKVILNYDK